MPVYPFKCLNCNHKFEIVSTVAYRDEPQSCPKCKNKMTKRTVPRNISFKIGENINAAESTRSDKYWENAEKNRLAALEKRRKENEDKFRSKDPETMAKLRRKIQNEEQLGRSMDDPVRIQEAKKIRKIIGEK